MNTCWEHNPKLRPSFSKLVDNIGSELEKMADYIIDVNTFFVDQDAN